MKTSSSFLRNLVASALGLGASALAIALPSVKIGTAALISPDSANTTYGAATTSTNTTGATARPNEIIELARALNNNPDAIYDYVRNNIDTTWMYGLKKGGVGALVDRSGTPFDQAHLMVELLRQAGYTASYKSGTITLPAANFTAWTGISNGVAACQLLSSGGIPATVNGFTNTSCSGVGSTLSSVTLMHVWVEVTIPGSSCASNLCQFDPSYKPYTVKAGRNLISDAGLTTGQALSSATSGFTSATDGTGVTYVRSLNATSLASRLTTYSGALQTAINNNVPAGEPEDLVGGRKITRYDPPAGQPGLRQNSIPFSPSLYRTWTGDIPDQYRTSLRVQVTRGNFGTPTYILRTDKTVFADEIGGRMLVYDASWSPTHFQNSTSSSCGAPSRSRLNLVSEDGTTRELHLYTEPNTSRACNPRYLNGTITLTVDHPYVAAANGTVTLLRDYMDASVVKRVWYTTPMIIMHGFGDIARSAADKWSQVAERGLPEIAPPGCETCAFTYQTAAGFARRMQLNVGWLAQTSVAARLHAQIANASYTHHHSIGVVTGDTEVPFVRRREDIDLFTYEYQVTENFDRIDVEMGFSLTSRTASATNRRAAVHAIAATVDALEGSVVGQHSDLPDVVSTATRFDWGNAPPVAEDPSGATPGTSIGARRFYEFTSSNHNHAATLVKNEGKTTTSDDGFHGPGVVEIGIVELNSRRNLLSSTISSYAQAGFTVIAAEDSFLGPGARSGSFVPASAPPVYRHEFSKQRGGAMVATRYSGGEPVEIAHVAVSGASFQSTVAIKGGGGGTQPHQQSLYDPSKAADILKARYVDRSSMHGVDLIAGSVSYTSPATLSIGTGGFPYELSATAHWRNGADPGDAFGPRSHIAPQTPWTTNWNNNLAVSSSALEVLGEGDVRSMAGTVAAFLAMQDVYKSSVSKEREVAANMVAAWWMRTLAGNVVTTSLGTETRQFVRLYDGTWMAPGAGVHATLTQTGQRVVYEEVPCGSVTVPTARGWNYDNVSFSVTRANGDVQNYVPWKVRFHDSASSYCAMQRGYRMSSWTFPQGMTINFVYQQPGAAKLFDLVEVNNSLGRRLKFVYTDGVLNSINNGLTGADLRSVSFGTSVVNGIGVYTHTDPGGAQTHLAPGILNDRHVLNAIFDADDTAVPSLRYTYDSLQRVKEVRDAGHLQGFDARGPYELFLANGVRAERRDPAGGRYTVFYDLKKRPMATQDELGRQTAIKYDGRGRVIEYVYPDQDREQFEYDARNNSTKLIKVAKPCSPQPCTQPANIIVQAAWNSTWNKPDYIINPRGFRTDFSYYPSGAGRSLLQSAVRPGAAGAAPFGSSARPTYTYTYNAYGQVLDSTDPSGLISRSAYSGAASLLQSTTLNPGGIAASTGFTFDAIGNLRTSTDPRGNVTEFEYDLSRRKLVTKRHSGSVSAPVVSATRSTYDALGQHRKEEGGISFSGTAVVAWQLLQENSYTPLGKLATQADNAGNITRFSYDVLDRVVIVADPDSRRLATVYDAAGQTLCTWRGWASTAAPATCSNNAGEHTLNAAIRHAEFTYTPNGLQATIRDANENLTTNEYDGFGRLVRTRFPVTTKGSVQSSTTDFEEYQHDASGNLVRLRKRDGRNILYTFDNLDRVSIKDIPDSSALDVYTEYDLVGRPLSARFGGWSGQGVVYTYDSAKRLESESTFGRALVFGYDLAENRTRMTFPDGHFIGYDYDPLNRMTFVRENNASSGPGVLASYTWDALSRRDFAARGNGTSTDYGYDAASRLNSLTQDLSGSSKDLVRTLGRNAAGQIRTRNTAGTAYDWSAALSNKNYIPDGLNRYSGNPYAYDANGNLTSDGVRSFTYDVENRLVRVTKGGLQTDISYDPMGRLWTMSNGSSSTEFLYDGDRLVAEYNGSNGLIQRRYAHGPGTDEPIVWYEGQDLTSRRWLHADERGSVIASTDGAGAGTEYLYGPFGEPVNWSGSRFRYTGQIALGDLELYHYKARVYDPVLGRFLQTDPIGYQDDFNLYSYAHGDPIGKVDPTGLEGVSLFDPGETALAPRKGESVPNLSTVSIDEVARNATKAKGVFVAGAHGGGSKEKRGTYFNDSSGDVDRAAFGAEKMLAVYKQNGYQSNMPLFMASCEAAAKGNAELMAKLTNQQVIATTGNVNYYNMQGDNVYFTASTVPHGKPATSTFSIYKPDGGRIDGIKSITIDTKTGSVTATQVTTETGSRIPKITTITCNAQGCK